MELLFKDEVYAIVGAAIEVHNTLGALASLKSVYQEAMQIELDTLRGNSYWSSQFPLAFELTKGTQLKCGYKADLVCCSAVLAGIKALDVLSGKEESQILNYLKATGLRVGVLLNFGNPVELEWRRFVH